MATDAARHSNIVFTSEGWLLDVPALIRARIGESATTMTRFDPAIKDNEGIRAPLQMLTNVLNLWESRDVGSLLAALR